MSLPLSVVVITLNESSNIVRCLRSAQWAGEMLVVDSGSRDNTCELAREYGAKVLQKEWLGFGRQKAWAAQQAKYDWILSVDADEEISGGLAAEIAQKLESLDPRKAYRVKRRSWFLGRWIGHGGWYPDWQIRLFNRNFANWNEAEIHERVVGAEIDSMQFPLHHFVFRDLSHQVSTNNRYSGLLADRDVSRGGRFSIVTLAFKPWFKFIECYFVKRGFLDGLPGFIIAMGAAYSVFLRQAKIWEKRCIESGKKIENLGGVSEHRVQQGRDPGLGR